MKFSASCEPDSSIQNLAEQLMHKLIAGRGAAPVISKAGGADNLMPPRKPFEQFFKCFRLNIGHGGPNRQGKEKFPEDTRELKDTLLLSTQPLNPKFQHLPQAFRRVQID